MVTSLSHILSCNSASCFSVSSWVPLRPPWNDEVASLSQVVARLARCVMGSARYVAALPALSSSSSDYYNEGSTTVIFCRPATGDSSHFVTWIMFGPALSVAQDV